MTDTIQMKRNGSSESHVDRAMRGPTPDNPSLSLRKRLKRAAFFDKRDREVAQGKAKPVDAEAGLPEAAIDEGFMLARSDGSSPEAHRRAA